MAPPLPATTPGDGGVQAAHAEILSRARAHERAGRLTDAVDAYRLALRAEPDPRVATRLVRVRREAAVARPPLDVPAGPWPPEVADPFPEVDGLPEVGPDQLSGVILGGSLLHHGCLIVRGVVPTDQAHSMRGMVIRSIEARDRTLADAIQPEDEHWYSRSRPRTEGTAIARRGMVDYGGVLAADSPLALHALLEAYRDAGVIDAISEHLGEPPLLSVDKTVLRKVLTSEAIWHQDGRFMAGGVRAVNVWLSLSDCGPGAATPSIDVVPTRIDEILETRTRGARYSPIAIGQALLDEVAPEHPWITPRFAPGDAILFDERFVHRSGSGEGYREHRYSVESWFFGASRVPTGYSPLLP